MTFPIIIVSGPTASGKSQLALELANNYTADIINADSVQVYEDLPILTAQPTKQEQSLIPHKLYGYLGATADINVQAWLDKVVPQIYATYKQGRIPFCVGGSGLYLKALMHGLSPMPLIDETIRTDTRKLFAKLGIQQFYENLCKLDPNIIGKINNNDSQRMMRAYEVFLSTNRSITKWQAEAPQRFFPLENFLYLFITPPRPVLYENCNNRFKKMLEGGVINEVKALYNMIGDGEYAITKAHGYKELVKYVKGEWTLEEAVFTSQAITRHYAKRQNTWFKHQVANGIRLEYDEFHILVSQVDKLISNFIKNFNR